MLLADSRACRSMHHRCYQCLTEWAIPGDWQVSGCLLLGAPATAPTWQVSCSAGAAASVTFQLTGVSYLILYTAYTVLFSREMLNVLARVLWRPAGPVPGSNRRQSCGHALMQDACLGCLGCAAQRQGKPARSVRRLSCFHAVMQSS
jgi:hypothetical protein